MLAMKLLTAFNSFIFVTILMSPFYTHYGMIDCNDL